MIKIIVLKYLDHIVFLVAVAWALSQIMTAHAAYIHVGAIVGTIMTANVWMIIIPNQRELVEATAAGTAPQGNRPQARCGKAAQA